MSPDSPWQHGKRVLVVVAALAVACSAALGVAPQPAAADVDYVFNVNCPLSHFGGDDPIVAPALPGSSHRHAFYGNSTTDAFTTTASLLASKSTCERGYEKADRSAYWVPSLYRKRPAGKFQEVRLSADKQALSAYYRRSGGTDGEKVKPFPRGLRMIAGDASTKKPQRTLDVAWRCNGDPGGAYFADVPNCPAETVLQAFVSFPDCWDGTNLDSADHRSHMAQAKGDRGTCPKSHPVKLPQLTFELSFRLPYVAGASYELSSGGSYSMHGDFFAAWDDRVQSALVNSCLNGGRYCENVERSRVNLAAAGPVPRGLEPTRSGPSPSPSATLAEPGNQVPTGTPSAGPAQASVTVAEQTGPGAAVALAGAAAVAVLIGSFFLLRRRPRRARHSAGE